MVALFLWFVFALGSIGGMDYAVQKGHIDCVWNTEADMCIMDGLVDSVSTGGSQSVEWIKDQL